MFTTPPRIFLKFFVHIHAKLGIKIRALPILVFANIADTDIADILLADMSTDTYIFCQNILSRYLHT